MSRRDEVLVSTEWVAAHADDPAYALIEVDEDAAAYEGGHIRNAIAWHWRDELHAFPRRDFLDQDGMAALLRRSGVGPDTTVVLYGGNNNWFATYAYWLLRYLGFDRVKLMDGGRKKWELEDRELVTEVPARAPADPARRARCATSTGPSATTCWATSAARAGRWWTSAARRSSPARSSRRRTSRRSSRRWAGTSRGPRTCRGRRPPNEDGSFKGDDELRDIYGSKGVLPDTDVISYCRIGERSSHTWFVLHELLGYERVRNYDGSWTEYGSLVGVPVERSARGRLGG